MAKARKILQRARSIRTIRTVTKTMEMVSTAQFRKSHNRVQALRPYTDRATDMVADIVSRAPKDHPYHHPLIDGHQKVQCDALLVLTSDRGLCGGYNVSVLRVAIQRRAQLTHEQYEVLLHVSGRQGRVACREQGIQTVATYPQLHQPPPFGPVADLADQFMADFTAGRISGLEVAYTQFISSARQRPVISQILPLSNLEPSQRLDLAPGQERIPYEFIPGTAAILDQLLPALVRVRLYQCFVDAGVSEQVARMTTMRSATENADEMIRDLTIRYNRTRQAQITNELAEIMGGSQGLER